MDLGEKRMKNKRREILLMGIGFTFLVSFLRGKQNQLEEIENDEQ